MKTWNATQTRQLPVFAAALPVVRIESAHPCGKQAERNEGREAGRRHG